MMLFTEMAVFYHVVESGSFSKAAIDMRVSKSFVSKKMQRLEAALQVKLIYRDSRKLKLTPEGTAFFDACQEMVQQGQAGYDLIQSLKGVPSGNLTLSLPPAISTYIVEPLLPEFSQHYPHITLTCLLESKVTNIINEGYDIAFRSAKSLEDSRLIARDIMTYDSYICATPQYLKQSDPINTPDDLTVHPFILFNGYQLSHHILFKDNTQIVINAKMYSDHLSFIKSMVMQGLGLGVFPSYAVNNELKNGSLIRCLQEHDLAHHHIYMIYPEREYMSLKTRVFIDFITQHAAHFFSPL